MNDQIPSSQRADAPETNHPAQHLWREVDGFVAPYPLTTMVPVPEPIPGTAFFPGGLGLWIEQSPGESRPLPALPAGKIMVLGQDFDTDVNYNKALEKGTEADTNSTWRKLKDILENAGIERTDCFFTDVYMGLRKAQPGVIEGANPKPMKNSGVCPGKKDTDFVKRCADFFVRRQLELLHPRLIIALGVEPLNFLTRHVPGVLKVSRPNSNAYLNFELDLPHGQCTIVGITHPSYYDRNVIHRYDAGRRGKEAEEQMIAEAFRGTFDVQQA